MGDSGVPAFGDGIRVIVRALGLEAHPPSLKSGRIQYMGAFVVLAVINTEVRAFREGVTDIGGRVGFTPWGGHIDRGRADIDRVNPIRGAAAF